VPLVASNASPPSIASRRPSSPFTAVSRLPIVVFIPLIVVSTPLIAVYTLVVVAALLTSVSTLLNLASIVS